MSLTKKYNFYNLPLEFEHYDYKESIRDIIGKYSKISNISSVYSWGDVSFPGISDIDILFVVNGEKKLPLLKRSFMFLDNKTKYAVCHPFVFIDKESFQKVRYAYPETSFIHLFGENIIIDDIRKNEIKELSACLLNDLTIRHYPRDFLFQETKRSIDVRNTLLRLNSLKYTMKMLKNMSINIDGLRKFTEDVYNLRNTWFDKNDFEKLVEMNSRAIEIGTNVIKELSRYLLDNKIIRLKTKNKIVYNGLKNKTIFVYDWKKQMLNKYNYTILPLALSAQLFEYAESEGPISSYIRRNIEGSLDYESKFSNIQNERIEIFNNQAKLASSLRHSDFPAFFDFGYTTKKGVNNWVLNLIRRIKK